MPASKKPETPIPVKLTQAQRRTVAELAPGFLDRLRRDERGQKTVAFTNGELGAILRELGTAVRDAQGPRLSSLEHLLASIELALERTRGLGAIPASERLYQFKIILQDTRPPIWRRIQVKDCTLDKLHEHIQTAMGWTNSHLHHFQIGGTPYGDPMLMEENFEEFGYKDSTRAKLSAVLPASGQRFRFEYEYDFGDSWHHDVLFEGCLRAEPGRRYPLCLEGERACPPEDVGGVWGYEEFLVALADPGHERHREFLGWIGRSFDPGAFDPAAATKEMKRGLPDWRELD